MKSMESGDSDCHSTRLICHLVLRAYLRCGMQGGLSKVLTALGEYQINLEYTYVIITRNKDFAYMIIRVEDNEKAEEALTKYGIEMVDQEALREL